MHPKIVADSLVLCVFSGVYLTWLSPAYCAAAFYELHPLQPDPASGRVIHAGTINNRGQVAATVEYPGPYGTNSVRFEPDGSVTPVGPAGTYGYMMFEDGRVLGQAGNGRDFFVSDEWSSQFLELPPDPDPANPGWAEVYGISRDGTVVGGVGGDVVVWSGADLAPVPLGRFNGQYSYATAISPDGRYIAGETRTFDGSPNSGFILHDGVFTAVLGPVEGFVYVGAVANDGTVFLDFTTPLDVVSLTYEYHLTGYSWKDGALLLLGGTSDRRSVRTASVNADGEAVGDAGLAAIFSSSGPLTFLDDLLVLSPPEHDWALLQGLSINDAGSVLVAGVRAPGPTGKHYAVLRPIPEPATMTWLGGTAPLLLRRSRRR
jgi:hypothetical protein